MCWPFWVVHHGSARTWHVVITFDGSEYAVYEDGHDAHVTYRAWKQRDFKVLRNPDDENARISAVLRVSRLGQAVGVIPVYRDYRPGEHDAAMWHSGMRIVQQSLENVVIQEWDPERESLYVSDRD
ncbi:MAG TPA: hypothetical protein VFH06_04360 [Candidatus Saccharimonadales bacterium]|nr:hypothetical protein [Candidatus Saccharimonadales bacterium]